VTVLITISVNYSEELRVTTSHYFLTLYNVVITERNKNGIDNTCFREGLIMK